MLPTVAACHTCKLRRVKCDGLKPTCQRCIKAGRLCVDAGVAKKALFSIHLENAYASGVSKRPRGPRSSLVILQPQLDLKTKALTYYLQYHFEQRNDIIKIRGGLSESVTVWLSSRKADSMVDLALSAMALAIFSRTQNYPPAASESSTCYQRLLRIMQRRITDFCSQDSSGSDIDACLLTVCIMGRYEGIFPHPVGQSEQVLGKKRTWPHHDGSLAVLKYWSDNFGHQGSTPFTKRMRREIIKHCLLRGMLLPDWALDGGKFGEEGLELDYDCILTRVVNLHHLSKVLHNETSYEMQTLKALALSYEVQHLDEALQAWAVKFEKIGSYEQRSLSDPGPFPRLHFYSPKVYVYRSQGHAGAWSDYFGTAMLIAVVRLRFLNFTRLCRLTGFAHAQQQKKCFERLEEFASNIAATLPFCLGRVKIHPDSTLVTIQDNADIIPYQTTFVIWALTIGSCLEGVELEHQNWFKQELASMGRISGEAVLESVITEEWGAL